MDEFFLDWDMISQRKLDMHDVRWIWLNEAEGLLSVWRVEGVPSDRVQSTKDGEEEVECVASKSSSTECFPAIGKRKENDAPPPPHPL